MLDRYRALLHFEELHLIRSLRLRLAEILTMPYDEREVSIAYLIAVQDAIIYTEELQ
jgi:hypothetical protein